MTPAKTCKSCGATKPLEEYHRNKRSGDGACRICKPCAIAVSRKNYRDRRTAAGYVPDERWDAERFLDYVEVTADCWIWRGPAERAGHFNYGRFCANNVAFTAHRWSYALHYGDLPAGNLICHHCDNPRCVRPDHLYAGDARTNAHDAMERNRLASLSGESNPAARLAAEQVDVIRRRWELGETQSAIARDVGMSLSQINRIVHRKSWTAA